jgi:hypothetical protein
MLRSDEWRAFDGRNKQLVFPSDSAESECARAPPAAVLADVFEMDVSQVWKIRSKARKKAKLPYRPPHSNRIKNERPSL